MQITQTNQHGPSHNSVQSRITGGPCALLFEAKVLGKYLVKYYRCEETGFIQTEEPYWLEEAYSDAITALDIGLVSRNLATRDTAATLIESLGYRGKKYVDFGGGYGMFVRLMRDYGYDFYRSDPFCPNLFAKEFDWDLACASKASVLTAWEVFEHLPDPVKGITQMSALSDTILFTTTLIPNRKIEHVNDWWYFIPETGQHVSLYTEEALEKLAKRFDMHLYSDAESLHLFSRQPLRNPFLPRTIWRMKKLLSNINRMADRFRSTKRGLLNHDFQTIRARLIANLEQSNRLMCK